jgi:hypothetical protein
MLVVPNFARTTLRASITPASTQLMLAIGGGAYFEIGSGNHMYVTIEDGQSVEIVKYTNTGPVVNDAITVERGQDGTTAKAFPAGACVKVAWNVAQVTELVEETYINLFNSSVLPPNTIQINSAPPTAPPPANVIYAVYVSQKQFWYWNGSYWTEIGNPRNGVLAGHGDPSGAPGNIVAFYVDLDNGALWYWGGSWIHVAGGGGIGGPSEEYWVRSNFGETPPLYALYPNDTGSGGTNTGQIELGVIPMPLTPRYRVYPNGIEDNTVLKIERHDGFDRMTLKRDAAMEITCSVRGVFPLNNPGSVPPAYVKATLQLAITNSFNHEFFGNSITTADFVATPQINVSTGVLTWPAETYFDGNLIYDPIAGSLVLGPFNIVQMTYAFHVVEADVPYPY